MTSAAQTLAWPAPTKVAARQEPGLQTAVLQSWRQGAALIDEPRLLAAAATGDVDGIWASLRTAQAASVLRAFVQPRLVSAVVSGVHLAGDGLAALGIPVRRGLSLVVERREQPAVGVSLDAVNPEAVAWARAHAAELVVADADIKAAIRALVVASQAHKITVDVLAQQVRKLVGLDQRRMAAVQAFRERLLADGVSPSSVARRTARYADAQRAARGLLIARTESIGALSHGQQKLWDQALQRGVLRREVLIKAWLITPDEITCSICEELGEEEVEIDGTFSTGDSGPPAHPACRCATGLRRRRE